MVRAGAGQVERSNPVGEHAHPVAAEAPQDRRGRGRAEAGRGHARLPRKRFADAGPDFAGQFALVEHGNATEHVVLAAADASDDNHTFFTRGMGLGGASRLGRPRRIGSAG